MNKSTVGLLLILTITLTAAAAEIRLDTLQAGFTTYTNVVVIDVNPADIYFQHAGGVANVKLRLLEPSLQRVFHFNPASAANAERDQLKSNDTYNHEAAREFASRVAKARVDAAASETVSTFKLSNPINERSPLDHKAPELQIEKWFSQPPSSSEGKSIFYFFWKSDSSACLEAIPTLNELCKKHSDSLIGIALSTETEDSSAELKTPLECSSGSDPEAKFATALGINSVPSVALVDENDIVRFIGHPSVLTDEALQKLLPSVADK